MKRARRRANGEGTIQTRRRNGKIVGYRGVVEVEGTAIYGPQTPRRSEALPLLYEKLRNLASRSGKPVNDSLAGPTLSTYASGLLKGRLRSEWAPGTIELGYTVLGRVEASRLGDMGIYEIGAEELLQWRLGLGIGASSANRYQRIVEKWLSIAGQKVKAPKAKESEPLIRILSLEQQNDIVQRAHQPRTQLALMLLLDTGLRAGEACGLRHEDREDDGGWIRRQGAREGLKSVDSNAWIPFTERLLERIGPPRTGYVLATENGTPMAVNNLRRMVRSVAEHTPYADITTQDLRHTAAVNMLRAGVDAKTVSTITRHSVDTLLKIYHRVEQDGKREALRRVELWKSTA